jgi:isochorismate pyruvate lyase
MNSRADPAQVATMVEVRAAVDSIDRALVALLAERMRFMDAAARIKPLRSDVRDEARKRQVLDNVGRHAAELGLDPTLAQSLWETLVEASIAHEFAMWDQLRR